MISVSGSVLTTDLSGRMVKGPAAEAGRRGLEEALELESRVFGSEAAKAAMSGYHELIVEGHREIYRVDS